MSSIRRRLMLSLFGLWILVWTAVALIAFDRSGHEVDELLDAQMAQTAHVLRNLSSAEPASGMTLAPQTLSAVGHPYEAKLSFQRWQGEQLVGSFGAAPAAPLVRKVGFSDQKPAGASWRVFGLPGTQPDELLIVAQDSSIRRELVGFLTINTLQPILWSLPLSMVLIWLAVSDGLGPLKRLAISISRRSVDRLGPIDGQGVPVEIRPLTEALNGLMAQLDEALAMERRFAADASHELRTPFAIIRTHAQIAKRSSDPAERRQALDTLILGVDQATRLITQLLTLSRLQGDVQEAEPGISSLAGAVTRAVAHQQAAAHNRSITLTTSMSDGLYSLVPVPGEVLGTLVSNLVENGVKYTPPGGWVQVALVPERGQLLLRVSDSGPGIPPAHRERVFDRFYRQPGQSQGGAGLGLAIVRRICACYGLGIELREGAEGVGLVVEVSFPLSSDIHS
ncbi:MAG: ATP-binding protein [Chromatiaceae bacterium]